MARLDRFISEHYAQQVRRVTERSPVQFFEQVPGPALRPFIKRFMVVEYSSLHRDTHLPDTSPVAAFSFRRGCRIDGNQWAPPAAFTGLRETLRAHEYCHGHAVLLATFTPAGAVQLCLQTFRIENRGNSIPNLYSRYAASRGGDDSDAIGQGNPAEGRLPSAHAVDNEKVAIVDRKCFHLQYDLPWPWRRVGTLHELQGIHAELVANFDDLHKGFTTKWKPFLSFTLISVER